VRFHFAVIEMREEKKKFRKKSQSKERVGIAKGVSEKKGLKLNGVTLCIKSG
jgi:hypothetical protein